MALDPYDGELAGNILLEDGDDSARPFYGGYAGVGAPPSIAMPPFFGTEADDRTPLASSPGGSNDSRRRNAREGESLTRMPTRTPSPTYQWEAPKKVDLPGTDMDVGSVFNRPSLSMPTEFGQASSSKGAAAGAVGSSVEPNLFNQQNPFFNQMQIQMQIAAAAAYNPQAYYGMMTQNPGLMGSQAASAAAASGVVGLGALGGGPGGGGGSSSGAQADSKPTGPQGSPMEYMQMMLAIQAQAAAMQQAGGGKGQPHPSSNSSAVPAMTPGANPVDDHQFSRMDEPFGGGLAAPVPSRGGLGGGGGGAQGNLGTGLGNGGALTQGSEAAGKRTKNRGGGKGEAVGLRAPAPEAAVPDERRSKGERRRRDRGGPGALVPSEEAATEQRSGGKSKGADTRPASNPIIEQLKSRERNIELCDLTNDIAEIAKDQYGSRLIQQKLEVASDEEKQRAFKAILQKMPQLTTDVFGNYVIQKFFEYGNAEQRRILAEQLVGQVLKLSHQMYGCRVVQKALDSVPIEQQVLLIGELKGHVIRCIEDQHGNHVIQKCIERLPTDKINFIVDSFDGQSTRMAKHCYGCRVIQRLIEYCSSAQISSLLDEVLRNLTDLATDQYGNYVVQHVMEHSSRPGDRQNVLNAVRKNINLLSCHKYASNVVEKALACGTYEERATIVQAIVGDEADLHPPLINMMRDRFGNYIVQRTIALAQSPQREALLWKLHEQMPSLKKSNTYGKHIITALDKAQASGPPP